MLQTLDSPDVFCVTLNDNGRIHPDKIIAEFEYAHPTFDINRTRMQQRHKELIDHHSASFCGAYWGNGFHEDGVSSALRVVAGIREVAYA